MESEGIHRMALLGVLATWCLYVVFALSTDWEDFGLTPTWPVDSMKYLVARVSIATLWVVVAAVLLRLRLRSHPVNLRSFSYSFASAAVTCLAVSKYLVVEGANPVAIAGSVLFYALMSGFLSATVGKPRVAAVLGPLLVTVQLLADGFVHMFTGAFRFH